MNPKRRNIRVIACGLLVSAVLLIATDLLRPQALAPVFARLLEWAPGRVSIFLPMLVKNWTPSDKQILWSADHETGDLSQWDGVWISSTANAKISTAHAHSGRYAAMLTVSNAKGRDESPGVRLAKIRAPESSDTLPDEAYYSVWYYFPQTVRPEVWWNVFQWKRKYERSDGSASSDPVYTINVGNRRDGSLYFYLYQHVGADGNYGTDGMTEKAAAPIDIPVERWVYIECYYRWSLTYAGQVTCWQDGQQIWDVTNVITDFNYGNTANPHQWTVNNYTNRSDPPTQAIFVDDAAISTAR